MLDRIGLNPTASLERTKLLINGIRSGKGVSAQIHYLHPCNRLQGSPDNMLLNSGEQSSPSPSKLNTVKCIHQQLKFMQIKSRTFISKLKLNLQQGNAKHFTAQQINAIQFNK